MPSFAAKAKEKGWGVEAITREALHWRVAKGMQAWWAVDKMQCRCRRHNYSAGLLEKRDDDGFDASSGVRDGERREASWMGC